MVNQMVLMRTQIAELEAANAIATHRKSHKRKRVREEKTCTFKDGIRLTTLKEFGVCSDGKKAKKRAHIKASELSQRHCGRCSKTGHNACTFKRDTEGTLD
jgi:hypothetical protein